MALDWDEIGTVVTLSCIYFVGGYHLVSRGTTDQTPKRVAWIMTLFSCVPYSLVSAYGLVIMLMDGDGWTSNYVMNEDVISRCLVVFMGTYFLLDVFYMIFHYPGLRDEMK